MSQFCTRELGNESPESSVRKIEGGTRQRLGQKAAVGVVIWETWEVEKLLGELGSDQTWLLRDNPPVRGLAAHGLHLASHLFRK